MKEGTLFVISAPSGAGKSTLCRELLRKVSRLKLSVSYTTRPPRKGEVNDVHYTFAGEKKFMNMIHKGEFAEWAKVHGNFYGTSLRRLKKISKEGYDILLDIDVQGAGQLRKTCRSAVYIFILPPSLKILKQRLADRKTEDEETISMRLERAKDEIAGHKDYDYVIINDKLERAYRELESIIIAERARTKRLDPERIKGLMQK
ncbi:MAG: guanylate kinase [Nitrospiraceae bacterium]|nr:MAG: guanylate kinase [Nitrospiraceae bacterium]